MHTTPIHTQAVTTALGRTERRQAGDPSGAGVNRADGVSISSAARSLAAQYASEGFTGDRIAVIRHRIENGSYNHPTFVQALAWRLIEAGIV